MRFLQRGSETLIEGAGEFHAGLSFGCGQCFQWEQQQDGFYLGIHGKTAARIRSGKEGIVLSGSAAEAASIWAPYLDLSLDYESLRRQFAVDELSERAAAFSAGIRILRQDPWEALCAFLISQCNNIPRITAILRRLRMLFGDPVPFEGKTLYAFPPADRLAGLTAENLAPLRAGYRAPYLLAAARAVSSGELDFEAVKRMETGRAREQVQKLPGVGRKVADCFLLYGLHFLDCWPEDTWMKKVAAAYPRAEELKKSPYAGIYQQYLFHYARMHF